jgi:hypothetical protein
LQVEAYLGTIRASKDLETPVLTVMRKIQTESLTRDDASEEEERQGELTRERSARTRSPLEGSFPSALLWHRRRVEQSL